MASVYVRRSGKVHGLLKGRVIGHAYAAAEVDITHFAVQRRLYPLGQRPAVPVAAAQHVRVQILGLQVHVDALHRHGQVVQQRLQLRQILLINAELAAGSHAAAHTEGGVHPHADGPPLSFPAAQRADTRHLAQRVGDDLALVPRRFQRRIGLSGGGEENVLFRHAACSAQQHLRGRGGVRAQTQRRQRPHHRRERIGLDGVQQVILGEGLAQRLQLRFHDIVFVEVTGRVLPRQRQNVLVHGDAPPFCYSPRHRKRAMSTVPLARKATPSASSSARCSGQWGAVRPAWFTTRWQG